MSNPSHAASFTLNSNGSFSYTPVTNYSGPDSFTYRAFDGQKNSNVATVTITVNATDTTPPDTTITFKPLPLTSNTTATFNFTSTEAGSSFACSLDNGAFAPCTSPQTYSGLSNGGHIFLVRATDVAGNTDPSPASHSWTIDTTRTTDTLPPVLAGFVIDTPSVDTTNGPATVGATLTAQDDLSGVSVRGWTVSNPSQTVFLGGGCQLVAGTSLDGTYRCTVNLPQFSEPGTWKVSEVFLRDAVANGVTYTTQQLAALGFGSTFVNTGQQDTTAPVLRSFRIDTPSVDTTNGPATVGATLTAQDDLSGVSVRGWTVSNPSQTVFLGGGCQLVAGTSLDGTYRCTVNLPQFSEPGTWKVSEVFLRDAVANGVTYTTQQLAALGFDSTFVNGPVSGSGLVTVLHSFTGSGAGGTGSNPSAGLIRGSDGNFYGTAVDGGANGIGTIFRMDGSGVVTVLHSFTGSGAGRTGSNPFAGLIQASDGNFYGTAVFGGVNNLGTIFRMDGSGVVTVLHSFTGSGAGRTGSNPFAGLVQGSDGNFYGTTRFGGVNNLGTIFRMDGSGVVTVLHSFTGSGAGGAGSNPFAGLIQGSDDNFYGTTQVGGMNDLGTIFRMDGNGVVTVLHSFTGSGAGGTGSNPFARLIQGSDGNFYGAAATRRDE